MTQHSTATSSTAQPALYIVDADTIDSVLESSDIERICAVREITRAALVRIAVDIIADATEAHLESHEIEGEVERHYDSGARRGDPDRADEDPQVWDRVLVDGCSRLRRLIAGIDLVSAAEWCEDLGYHTGEDAHYAHPIGDMLELTYAIGRGLSDSEIEREMRTAGEIDDVPTEAALDLIAYARRGLDAGMEIRSLLGDAVRHALSGAWREAEQALHDASTAESDWGDDPAVQVVRVALWPYITSARLDADERIGRHVEGGVREVGTRHVLVAVVADEDSEDCLKEAEEYVMARNATVSEEGWETSDRGAVLVRVSI